MPRFFFDIEDGVFVRDEEGLELDGQDAIRREAAKAITAIASDAAQGGAFPTLVLTVRDMADQTVLRVRLVCSIEDL
ncbi:DUF6894 family protein [Methylobacterium organophilum]|uniref:DUF6894 domain-containing protein n=1 Tax=Methylobacterium organophilum TaxID=410 RepID=A0ABQ4TEJ0_METOR|nr:hypothetical protein [Methylobacterium organophilum]UMY17501.1 hypothetical protein MMB17_23270 [Methylobacterium organophilum]GJE29683.1 hypothetical protein LKMONMHP_4567 [Methylobacterium organophilum]